MSFSIKRAVIHAIWGHVFGFSFILLLSCAAMMLPYPSEATVVAGLLPQVFAALSFGLIERRAGVLLKEAILTGAIYGASLFVVSCFGVGAFFSLGMRGLLSGLPILISLVPSLFFHKKKRRRRMRRR